ncbi:MAG: hypothetical protein WD073_10520 [Xanthobacteraceae bacterium]
MKVLLRRFIEDTSGQGLLAEVLLISGLSLMIVPTVQEAGARLAEVFDKLAQALR